MSTASHAVFFGKLSREKNFAIIISLQFILNFQKILDLKNIIHAKILVQRTKKLLLKLYYYRYYL